MYNIPDSLSNIPNEIEHILFSSSGNKQEPSTTTKAPETTATTKTTTKAPGHKFSEQSSAAEKSDAYQDFKDQYPRYPAYPNRHDRDIITYTLGFAFGLAVTCIVAMLYFLSALEK